MPDLVPGIPLRRAQCVPKRDGRDKPGHDKKLIHGLSGRHLPGEGASAGSSAGTSARLTRRAGMAR